MKGYLSFPVYTYIYGVTLLWMPLRAVGWVLPPVKALADKVEGHALRVIIKDLSR